MHLYFIKFHYVVTSDKWNTWNHLHLYVYFLKKEIHIWEPVLSIYNPRYKNNKDLFIDRDLLGAVFHSRQRNGSWAAVICLDNSSHAFKAAITSTAHSIDPQEALQEWGNDVQPDGLRQNTLEGEKSISSKEKNQALGWEAINQHTRPKHSLSLPHTPYMEGGSEPIERSSPPKNRSTQNQIISSNRSGPLSNRPPQWSHVTKTDILRHAHHKDWHIA